MTSSSDLPPSAAGSGEPQPLAQAARCLHKINRPFVDGRSVEDLTCALAAGFTCGTDTETRLYTQAHLLDALFQRMIFHDMFSKPSDPDVIPYIRNDELLLVLRTQRHCRITVEALERVRNKKRDQKRKHDEQTKLRRDPFALPPGWPK